MWCAALDLLQSRTSPVVDACSSTAVDPPLDPRSIHEDVWILRGQAPLAEPPPASIWAAGCNVSAQENVTGPVVPPPGLRTDDPLSNLYDAMMSEEDDVSWLRGPKRDVFGPGCSVPPVPPVHPEANMFGAPPVYAPAGDVPPAAGAYTGAQYNGMPGAHCGNGDLGRTCYFQPRHWGDGEVAREWGLLDYEPGTPLWKQAFMQPKPNTGRHVAGSNTPSESPKKSTKKRVDDLSSQVAPQPHGAFYFENGECCYVNTVGERPFAARAVRILS
jgi:hypothetical protein